MANQSKNGDYTEEEMAEFDRIVRQTGKFPPDSVFDPQAEARGEPRWRKNTPSKDPAKAKRDNEE